MAGRAQAEPIRLIISPSKPTVSQREQYQRCGAGKFKWNAAITDVINYTWAVPDMTTSTFLPRKEDRCQSFWLLLRAGPQPAVASLNTEMLKLLGKKKNVTVFKS